ncbi:MAG: ABC transporter ATP-binding protein [Candidatus Levybacteria bacterium]|nr:ABC transporter ATP-binding protein [Candidatus Levybacteria bacterium]
MNDSKDFPKLSWWQMIKAILFLAADQKKKYLFFNSVLLTVLFYDIVPPYVIGKIVDFFASYKAGVSLTPFYLYVIFLAVTTLIIAFIRLSTKNTLGKLQSQITYNVKVKGFERLLDFSIKWHDKENTGNKVQKIQNGADAMMRLQRILGSDLFVNLASTIGVLTAFLFLNQSFFFYSLLYLAIFMLVQARFYNRYLRYTNEYNASLEKASGTYYEGLSNVLTIKTLGVKEDFKKNITSREELSRDNAIRMVKLGTDKWKFFQFINALFLAGVILLAGHGFINKTITLGSIFIFFNYFQKLSQAVGQSTNFIDDVMNIRVSIGRMMPIFWEKSTASEGRLNFPRKWEELIIKNGNFDYRNQDGENKPSDDAALKNINITIKKNEKIGIVGRSGSGKSTLAKVLLALYKFSSGTYKIGGINIYEIKHDELTQKISLVLQESEMFNISLKENITMMRRYNSELFGKAIKISQLEDLIAKLPEGLNTLIGEKGYRLSGGERQRIGIARAIYKDPQILVLDEATSSLDSKTESLIQEALEKELDQKTVISIAHRVSTLRNADRIIVFENGEIAEEGKFKDLSENQDSAFSKLYQNQKS